MRSERPPLARDEGRHPERIAGIAGIAQILLVEDVVDERFDPVALCESIAEARVDERVAALKLILHQVGDKLARREGLKLRTVVVVIEEDLRLVGQAGRKIDASRTDRRGEDAAQREFVIGRLAEVVSLEGARPEPAVIVGIVAEQLDVAAPMIDILSEEDRKSRQK